VRDLVRQHFRFFVCAALAALALRLFFVFKFPHITDDSKLYGELANNWLLRGVYGITTQDSLVSPSFARLPGYPAFLALVFAIFGIDNYQAALILQALIDVSTCFVVADLARRCISDRAAKAAFLLTALCPFLAQYAAAALTETLEIFFTALALDFAVMGMSALEQRDLRPWLKCGASIAACILLRPDGGILLAATGGYLGFTFVNRLRQGGPTTPLVRAGVAVAACGLAPLVVWGVRNFHTLHRLELLAPRYANEEGEFVPLGFNRWTKTWIADYVSTEEVYWNVPGAKIDSTNLPSRAFDSEEEHARTLALIDAYNDTEHITPDLDAKFATLANERVHAHPLRYYLWLPILRMVDMWLRPRTELLPPDSRWYQFDDDTRWIVLAVALGILNLLYLLAAAAGLVWGESIACLALGLWYVVLRSLFLGTLENPEARYTLECYPVVILMASALFSRGESRASIDLWSR
jgi:4-amino-4-deoxy-L-arabinose transferase-like glycosyltransferase